MSGLPLGNRPIRQPDHRSSAEVIRITGLIFGVAAPFIAYMWISAAQLKGEYRLSRLVEERRQLTKEHERLSLSKDALMSPEVIDKAAREKLGMVDEDPAELLLGVPPPTDRDTSGSKESVPSSGAPGSRSATHVPPQPAPPAGASNRRRP
jgi:cell division protein FtsL